MASASMPEEGIFVPMMIYQHITPERDNLLRGVLCVASIVLSDTRKLWKSTYRLRRQMQQPCRLDLRTWALLHKMKCFKPISFFLTHPYPVSHRPASIVCGNRAF
jgi:hypothetical protein